MKKNNYDDLTFEKFRELAGENGLSSHEKVGFPDEYREGKEESIFFDVSSKLPILAEKAKNVLEIGPGCSHLPMMLVELCNMQGHQLHFVDSAEMLIHLPDQENIHKWAGRYPEDVGGFLSEFKGQIDVVITYSVIQYIYSEGNLWNFLDQTLDLLSPGGEILFGDIPNITMRKRFFSSAAGIECHHQYTGRAELPEVHFNKIERGHIDDSVVLALLARARAQGFHAWVVPQRHDLPMANRREDILIKRP